VPRQRSRSAGCIGARTGLLRHAPYSTGACSKRSARDAITSADAAASALLSALKTLIPDPNAAGIPVTLHGFDPGDGQPRGLVYWMFRGKVDLKQAGH
jgi:hypothetical protein